MSYAPPQLDLSKYAIPMKCYLPPKSAYKEKDRSKLPNLGLELVPAKVRTGRRIPTSLKQSKNAVRIPGRRQKREAVEEGAEEGGKGGKKKQGKKAKAPLRYATFVDAVDVDIDYRQLTVVIVGAVRDSWCPTQVEAVAQFGEKAVDFVNAMRKVHVPIVFALADAASRLDLDEEAAAMFPPELPTFLGDPGTFSFPLIHTAEQRRAPSAFNHGNFCGNRTAMVSSRFGSGLPHESLRPSPYDYMLASYAYLAAQDVKRRTLLFIGDVQAMSEDRKLSLGNLCRPESTVTKCVIGRDLLFSDPDLMASFVNRIEYGKELTKEQAMAADISRIEQFFAPSILTQDVVDAIELFPLLFELAETNQLAMGPSQRTGNNAGRPGGKRKSRSRVRRPKSPPRTP